MIIIKNAITGYFNVTVNSGAEISMSQERMLDALEKTLNIDIRAGSDLEDMLEKQSKKVDKYDNLVSILKGMLE